MTAGTVEKIQVILQAVTSGFARGLGRAQTQLKTVGKNMQNFGSVMQMPMNNFKELNGRFKVMKTLGGKVAQRFRMMTHGMRGFRMEALGVMFFGMMMQRMFLGLLQPVMEAFGVFDIFRLMLLTLFLPIMEMIFPFLLSLMEWFMDLPEPVKKAIGIFVILGVIFGTIIMVLGQFALGIGSLIQFFPIFGSAIQAVGAFLVGLSATALAVIAVIVAIVIGMYVAWKENFMGMKMFVKDFADNIKKIFEALWAILKAIFGFWIAVFKGDWDAAWQHIKDGFEAVWKLIKNILLGFLNFCAMVAIGVIRVFKWIVDMIVGFFVWLYNKLVGHSIIPDMINGIINWFWKLPQAILSIVKVIGNAFVWVGNGIIGVWNSVMGAISKAIVTVLRGVDVVLGVLNKIPGINIGKYSWNVSWGQLPMIPKLAGGGIITQPTLAMIGESGPEAVVPLGSKGGFGSNANITQENHFHGFTMDDLKRELDNRDRRLVDDIRRLVKQ